jgi:hypothetical protein
LCGTTCIVIGLAGVTLAGIDSSRALFVINTSLIGIGMGLSSPVFLIAVQTSMPKATLGTATSTLQLSRSIGTAIGVTLMGAILSFQVGQRLEHGPRAASVASIPAEQRVPLAAAQREVFGAAFLAGLASVAFTLFAPRGRLRRRLEERVQGGEIGWAPAVAGRTVGHHRQGG